MCHNGSIMFVISFPLFQNENWDKFFEKVSKLNKGDCFYKNESRRLLKLKQGKTFEKCPKIFSLRLYSDTELMRHGSELMYSFALNFL